MKRLAAVILLITISGCGVDGPPERPLPDPEPKQTGVSISGYGRSGVVAKL